MINPNLFLKEYSLQDLKILIEECNEYMEDCRYKDDKKLDENGIIYNEKLDILNNIFHIKVEDILKKIKIQS